MARLGPKDSRKARRVPRRSLVMEDCEPRILYSAEFLPLQPDMHDQADIGYLSAADFAVAAELASNQSATQHAEYLHEFVIVDAATPDHDKLVADADGIDQITDVLAQYRDLDAVHLIAHGSDGEVQLGNTALNFESFSRKRADFQGILATFTATDTNDTGTANDC